ncbi:unnamed protein product [Linum trigynum]|uniref:Uncharacterized protein n=1 Tax=Linum trigynum TaxID=586398 RepID=A0AAV2EFX1_9ROSI
MLYSSSKVHHSLFNKVRSSSFTDVLVYVDFLIMRGNGLIGINNLKDFLHRTFKIKDLVLIRRPHTTDLISPSRNSLLLLR